MGQTASSDPSQSSLDEAVRLGSVAALAPICALRTENWAFDLRRAAILEATRATRSDDPSLHNAAGSRLVVGALSFAEAEALESFAAAAPAKTCESLRVVPELVRADGLAKALQELRANMKPAS